MKVAGFSVISGISAGVRRLLFRYFLLLLLSGGALVFNTGSAYASDGAETPYGAHGNLTVTDSGLTDMYGEAFQLRGVSTLNLAWAPEYVSEETFRTLRDVWQINTVRLSVYPAEEGGYCFLDDTQRQAYRELLAQGVEAACELGLYVIIDWHTLTECDPNVYKDTALSFFGELSYQFRDCGNVLYEVCSDPNTSASWDSITSYAVDVIDMIRGNAPASVIIVGTPDWSTDVEIAAANPIDRGNLLYSLHFYANNHQEEQRQKAVNAIRSGLPVLVSQFSVGDAYGSGEINLEQGDLWLDLLDEYQIGYVIWNLSNKDSGTALLSADCTSLSGWSYDELTAGTQWFIQRVAASSFKASAATPTADASVSWPLSNGCTAEISEVSGLYGSPESCEYTVILTNPTETAVNTWRLRFTWNTEIISHQDFWSCDIGGSGTSRLIIPKDYNTVILPGAAVSFGFTVTGSAVPSLIDVVPE